MALEDAVKRRFGKKLRALRLASGLSQEQLAFRAKLHRTYVSSAERGQRNVSLVNLHKLARALRIDVGEFFQKA